MATQVSIWEDSFVAENDLSASQFRIVEISGTDQVDVCDNAADIPFGILQNKPKAGHAAEVMMIGRSRVVSDGSGAAIAAGDPIGTDNQGRAVKKTADGAWCIGQANSPSSAAGVIIDVTLRGPFMRGA